MAIFPAEEVDRIISEELARAENGAWTTPEARRRYQALFLRLVMGPRPNAEEHVKLLDAVIEGIAGIARYCTDRDCLFMVDAPDVPQFEKLLQNSRSILIRVLSARQLWSPSARIAHDLGERFLRQQEEQLADMCRQLDGARARGVRVGFRSDHVVALDCAFHSCVYLLLSEGESLEYDAFYNRAQSMLRGIRPFIEAGGNLAAN